MTLVKNWTIYIIQDDSFNSSFAVNNHRKLIKIDICPKFKREGGVSKQAKCLNFVRPKLPRLGGGLGNLGQCLKFYCFFKGIP